MPYALLVGTMMAGGLLAAQMNIDMAVMQKWEAAKVIRYRAVGVYQGRTRVIFGDREGKADVKDTLTLDFVWDKSTRKMVGPVTILDGKSEVSNLKSEGTNCPPPTLMGEYQHFKYVKHTVQSDGLIMMTGVRTFPAASGLAVSGQLQHGAGPRRHGRRANLDRPWQCRSPGDADAERLANLGVGGQEVVHDAGRERLDVHPDADRGPVDARRPASARARRVKLSIDSRRARDYCSHARIPFVPVDAGRSVGAARVGLLSSAQKRRPMLKSSLVGLAALAVLSAAGPAAAQTAPAIEPYTFVAQWNIPRAQWGASWKTSTRTPSRCSRSTPARAP